MPMLDQLQDLIFNKGPAAAEALVNQQTEDKVSDVSNMLSNPEAIQKMKDMSPEELYLYMAENDPNNSSGWMTNYASLKAQTHMRDTALQSVMDQMKASGINPLMAINQISGMNVSGAGYSASSDLGYQETQKATTNMSNKQKAIAAVMSFVASIYGSTMGAAAKAMAAM